MKIEVGKSYKTTTGREYLIEVCLTQPLACRFPYIGTNRDGEASTTIVRREVLALGIRSSNFCLTLKKKQSVGLLYPILQS